MAKIDGNIFVTICGMSSIATVKWVVVKPCLGDYVKGEEKFCDFDRSR